MKKIVSIFIVLSFVLVACGGDKRFDEAPALRQPEGIIDCSFMRKNDDKENTVTYMYSFGEETSETKALELTGKYLDEIKKDGFTCKDAGQAGYYSIMDGDKRVATMGINVVGDYGVCLIFVLDK